LPACSLHLLSPAGFGARSRNSYYFNTLIANR
jgi:hypothetical protein